MKTPTWALAVVLLLAACSDSSSSPTGPASTPLTPQAPPAQNATDWSVTQRFVSVTGPDNCWVRDQRQHLTGVVFAGLPFRITRSGTSITLESEFVAFQYNGSSAGREFAASGGPLEGGGRPCPDGTSFIQLPGVSNLAGKFSDDDQQLTVTEVNTYELTSGGTVKYTWDWVATRKN